MSGYIKLHRGWHDSSQFANEPYCERAAWCWLLTSAAWKDSIRRNHKGEIVTVQRGQFHTSLRVLSAEWRWSIKRVRTFIKVLEKCEAIGTIGAHGGTTITICNYEEYQSSGHDAGTREGTMRAQSGHTQEEGKEVKKKEEAKASNARAKPIDFPCPDGVDQIDWNALKANRKAKRAALSEGAYRQIIKKLDGWQQAGWPPGPIVAYAAERGWTTVFETDEMKVTTNGNGNRKVNGKSIDGRSSLARAIDEGLDWLDGTQAGIS